MALIEIDWLHILLISMCLIAMILLNWSIVKINKKNNMIRKYKMQVIGLETKYFRLHAVYKIVWRALTTK